MRYELYPEDNRLCAVRYELYREDNRLCAVSYELYREDNRLCAVSYEAMYCGLCVMSYTWKIVGYALWVPRCEM